jgi:hypothetical protein
MADDDTVRVVSSHRSRKSSVVAGGPVVIGGRVFTIVKRCPLCMLRNCDPNVILSGPLGLEFVPFLIWQRGSPENPEGRFDKVCIGAWTEGGFDQEHSNPDEFIEKRKTEPQLQAEFDGARSLRVAHRGGGFDGRTKAQSSDTFALDFEFSFVPQPWQSRPASLSFRVGPFLIKPRRLRVCRLVCVCAPVVAHPLCTASF